MESRVVNPVQQAGNAASEGVNNEQQPYSKVVVSEGEFRQLVGDSSDGIIARFVQNKLNLMFWHRSNADTNLIFGAQIDLRRLVSGMQELVRVGSGAQ